MKEEREEEEKEEEEEEEEEEKEEKEEGDERSRMSKCPHSLLFCILRRVLLPLFLAKYQTQGEETSSMKEEHYERILI